MNYKIILTLLLCSFTYSIFGQQDTILAHKYYKTADSLLRNEIDYHQSVDLFKQALEIYLPAYGEDHPRVARTYNRIGVGQRYLFQLKNAVKSGEKAVAIFEKLGMTHDLDYGTAVGELAGTLSQLGNFEKSITFYGKTMEVYLSQYGEDDLALAPLYYNIGNTHLGKENPDLAITYFEKALRLDQIDGGELYIADDYDNLGLAYQTKGDYDKALQYYDDALRLFYKVVGEENEYTIHALKLKGECLLDMSRTEEATKVLETAHRACKAALGENNKEMGDIRALLGKAYAESGAFSRAADAFDHAFKSLGYEPKQPYHFGEVSSLVNLAMVFNLRGAFLEKQWKTEQAEGQIEKAIENYEIAAALIDTIRLGYREKGAKLDIAENSESIYEGGIRMLYAWYQKTSSADALQKLVHFFEKDKSLLILESLVESNAENFAGIPADLLQRETELESRIAFLEEEKFAEQQFEDADQDLIMELNSKIYDAKQAYFAFKEQLEQEYPQYFSLKFNLDVLDLDAIEAKVLSNHQTLIEFFSGEETLYALLIQKNRCIIHRYDIGNAQLSPLVSDLRSGLYDYFLLSSAHQNKENYDLYLKRYTAAAYELYRLIIQPLQAYQLTERLTIVPDGILGYIPFDALLSERVRQVDTPFRDYPFLAKKYNISYNYSATLLNELQNRKYPKKSTKLLAFAPVFSDDGLSVAEVSRRRQNLGPLKFNIPEVEAIASIFPGLIFTADQATEDNFRTYAGDYSLIHLSTHGKANDRVGDYSFLAFTEIPDQIENEILYVRDLYGLNLKAELVVLSACETGIGELQKGEGIVSLASGFSYAGAKSILTTLWSINDAQTKDIMTRFYQNLADGWPKDEALFRAKQTYIQESRNDKAHPFYWAAYIPLGDMTIVQSGSFDKKLLWSILILTLIGLIIIFVMYRRNQSSPLS